MIKEKEEEHLDGKTIEFMKVNGKMESNMESEFLHQKMELLKKENGKTVKKFAG